MQIQVPPQVSLILVSTPNYTFRQALLGGQTGGGVQQLAKEMIVKELVK